MFGKKRRNEQEEYEFEQDYDEEYDGQYAEIPADDPEEAEELIPENEEAEAAEEQRREKRERRSIFRPSMRKPNFVLSVAVGVVLMLAVVLAAFYFVNRNKRREEAFRDAAVAVTGRVIKIERLPIKQREQIYGTGEPLFLLRAQYDYEGKRYTGAKRSYFGMPPYEIGEPITVYVNPKDPTKSKILGEKEE